MKRVSSTNIVLEALQDLHSQEQIVTREAIAVLTGLKEGVVDDRLKHLVNEGLAARVQRGVYVPVEQHPPARHISKTILPDGTVKIDIGDQVLTLTPREDRMLANLQAGVTLQSASVELGHQTALMTGAMNSRLNRLERILCRVGDGVSVGQDVAPGADQRVLDV
jgi:alcohol dehydrogenase class IV